MAEYNFVLGDSVINRYVKSLHDVSISLGIERETLQQIRNMKEFITNIDDHKKVLKKASLMFAYGIEFISKLKTELKLSQEVAAFLDLLRKNRRLSRVIEICDEYISVTDRENKKKVVFITYAKKFSKPDEKKLLRDIGEIFDSRIECIVKKDSSLIDGIKIQYRSKILDYSMKSRLSRLHNAINGGEQL